MTGVATAFDIRDFVPEIRWTGRRRMEETTPLTFRDQVFEIFPDVQSARLSRQFDVRQKTAQLWMKGELPVPDDVVAWVDRQHGLAVRALTIGVVEEQVRKWLEAGVHREVVAAHLSRVYTDLMDLPII